MFGLGPTELFLATFVWILPAALIVYFLILISRISRNIGQISQSMQSIEKRLERS
jgi:hypothetical protein